TAGSARATRPTCTNALDRGRRLPDHVREKVTGLLRDHGQDAPKDTLDVVLSLKQKLGFERRQGAARLRFPARQDLIKLVVAGLEKRRRHPPCRVVHEALACLREPLDARL